jgi:hypothetical protein
MSRNPNAIQLLPTVVIPIATVVDIVLLQHMSAFVLALSFLPFLVVQRRHIAEGIKRTSLALTLVTGLALMAIDQPIIALEKGLRIGALIASLLISVSLMSKATLRVPRMRKVMSELYAIPRGKRPLALGIGAQFMGGFLGLAGLTMMMDMAAQREEASDREQIADFSAISRGYAALALWSPMYSNMSIVLAMYQGIAWTDVLPYSLAISAVFIGLGALIEKVMFRQDKPELMGAASILVVLKDGVPIIGLMLCFLGFMVWASNSIHASISAIIIVCMPVIAWLLNVWQPSQSSQRWRSGSRQLLRDLLGQGGIAGEVLLFLVSGCAGTVVAQAIPMSLIQPISQFAVDSPVGSCMLVMMAIIILSGTSMHPMLCAVLVGSSFTPQLLNLPSLAHLCAVLVGWGLAIIITPFSVLSMMAARFSGIPVLTISLRANLFFVVICLTGAAMILGWAVA